MTVTMNVLEIRQTNMGEEYQERPGIPREARPSKISVMS